jgi:DNA-binding response OmpR family regulator
MGENMNKILILDDDEFIQMLYAEELTEEGYDVITSGDDPLILELIDKEDPDLVLMETKLIEHDGLDLLQDIRNTHYNLPVILCTAYTSLKYDLRSIAADYYVVKSSNLKELKFKIKIALEGGIPLLSTANLAEVRQRKTIPMEQMEFDWQENY